MSIFRKKKPVMFDPMEPLFGYGYYNGWEPKFEYCSEVGFDRFGRFYNIQPGPGGGVRYISCGGTDRDCEASCCEHRALFFDKYGRPLFFCRNHYCLYLGEAFVDKREKESNEVEK